MNGKAYEFFLEKRDANIRVRVLLFEKRLDMLSYSIDTYRTTLGNNSEGSTFYRSSPKDKIVGEVILNEEELSIENLSHEIDHAVILLYRWTQGTFNLGKAVSEKEEEAVTLKSTFFRESLRYLYSQGFRIDPIQFYIRRIA